MKDAMVIKGFTHQIEIVDRETGRVKYTSPPAFNLIPDVGRDFLAQAPFGAVSPISDFYIGLFDGNYVPSSAATSADLPSVIGEFVAYTQGARPLWVRSYEDGTHDNEDNRAVFSPTTDRIIRGVFMCSSSAKGGNTGLLLSVFRLDDPRPATPADDIRVLTSITYVPITALS
jgi:hypothetical protein